MNKVLGKIAGKVLLAPLVKGNLKKICELYGISRLEQEREFFKDEFEFYRLVRAGPLGLREEFPKADADALQKLVSIVEREGMLAVEVGSWTGDVHLGSCQSRGAAQWERLRCRPLDRQQKRRASRIGGKNNRCLLNFQAKYDSTRSLGYCLPCGHVFGDGFPNIRRRNSGFGFH